MFLGIVEALDFYCFLRIYIMCHKTIGLDSSLHGSAWLFQETKEIPMNIKSNQEFILSTVYKCEYDKM